MRLKEDNSSWRASNILRKISQPPETTRRSPAKKNTARWCKGKVGVSHLFVSTGRSYKVLDFSGYQQACTTCGKTRWL